MDFKSDALVSLRHNRLTLGFPSSLARQEETVGDAGDGCEVTITIHEEEAEEDRDLCIICCDEKVREAAAACARRCVSWALVLTMARALVG